MAPQGTGGAMQIMAGAVRGLRDAGMHNVASAKRAEGTGAAGGRAAGERS